MDPTTRAAWSSALRHEDTTGVKGLVSVISRTRSRRVRYEAAKQVVSTRDRVSSDAQRFIRGKAALAKAQRDAHRTFLQEVRAAARFDAMQAAVAAGGSGQAKKSVRNPRASAPPVTPLPPDSSDEEEPGAAAQKPKEDYGWLYEGDGDGSSAAGSDKPRPRLTRRPSLHDRAKFAGIVASVCMASVRYAPGGLQPTVAFYPALARSMHAGDLSTPVIPTVCFETEAGGLVRRVVQLHTDIGGELHATEITSPADFETCYTAVLSKLCAPGARMSSGPVAVMKAAERTPSGLGASNSCRLLWSRDEVRHALDSVAKFVPMNRPASATSRKKRLHYVVFQPFVQGLSGRARILRMAWAPPKRAPKADAAPGFGGNTGVRVTSHLISNEAPYPDADVPAAALARRDSAMLDKGIGDVHPSFGSLRSFLPGGAAAQAGHATRHSNGPRDATAWVTCANRPPSFHVEDVTGPGMFNPQKQQLASLVPAVESELGVKFLEFAVDFVEDGKTWHLLQVKGFRLAPKRDADGRAASAAPARRRQPRRAGSMRKVGGARAGDGAGARLRRVHTTPAIRFQGKAQSGAGASARARRASVASSVSTASALSTARSGSRLLEGSGRHRGDLSHRSAAASVASGGSGSSPPDGRSTMRRSPLPGGEPRHGEVGEPGAPGESPGQTPPRRRSRPRVAVAGAAAQQRAGGRAALPSAGSSATTPSAATKLRPRVAMGSVKDLAARASRSSPKVAGVRGLLKHRRQGGKGGAGKDGSPAGSELKARLQQFKFKPYRGTGETTTSITTSSSVFVAAQPPPKPPSTPEWYRKIRDKHLTPEKQATMAAMARRAGLHRPVSPVSSPSRQTQRSASPGSDGGDGGDAEAAEVPLSPSLDTQADDFVRQLFGGSPRKAAQPPPALASPVASPAGHAAAPPVPERTLSPTKRRGEPDAREAAQPPVSPVDTGVADESHQGGDGAAAADGALTARSAAVTPRYEGMSEQDIAEARRERPFKTASAVFAAFEEMLTTEAKFDAAAAARRAAAEVAEGTQGAAGTGNTTPGGSDAPLSELPTSPLLVYSSDEDEGAAARESSRRSEEGALAQEPAKPQRFVLRRLTTDDDEAEGGTVHVQERANTPNDARGGARARQQGGTTRGGGAPRGAPARGGAQRQRQQASRKPLHASGSSGSIRVSRKVKARGPRHTGRGRGRTRANTTTKGKMEDAPLVTLPSKHTVATTGADASAPAGSTTTATEPTSKAATRKTKRSAAESRRRRRLAKAAMVAAYSTSGVDALDRAASRDKKPKRREGKHASGGARRPGPRTVQRTTVDVVHIGSGTGGQPTPGSNVTAASDMALLNSQDMDALLQGSSASIDAPLHRGSGQGAAAQSPALRVLHEEDTHDSPTTVGSDVPLLGMDDLLLLQGESGVGSPTRHHPDRGADSNTGARERRGSPAPAGTASDSDDTASYTSDEWDE